MFYEEKTEQGITYFRTTPDGEWFVKEKQILTLEDSGIIIKRHQNVSTFTPNKKYIPDFGEWFYKIRLNGRELSAVAETYDMALLIALSVKYDGHNTQFHMFAARALKIESVWAD